LEQAEAADAEKDAGYGRDRRGDELPAELARRETRLKRILETKRALEERARAGQSKGEPEKKAKPKAKMQYNFTDPESRIMPGTDGFVQAYNAQIAVEPDLQWIVGQTVTQATPGLMMFPRSPPFTTSTQLETLLAGCIQNPTFRNSGRCGSAWINSWSAYPAIAKYSSVFNGTRARIVVPAPGCDFTENSPCTNCNLSRMLIKPRPWRVQASCS
jgi:hypothetical protein